MDVDVNVDVNVSVNVNVMRVSECKCDAHVNRYNGQRHHTEPSALLCARSSERRSVLDTQLLLLNC